MKTKTTFSSLLALLFAVGVFGSSVVYADETHSDTSSETTTETVLVKLTDPEIAAAEDEEPDCE